MSYFTAEKLGFALARARVAAGLSQVDMARRINKGKATVQSWECGASSPPADKIMDWFEACGASPLPAMQEMLHPELYKEPIQRKSDEDLDKALTEYFRTAPRIVKEMVLFILLGRHGSYPPAVFAEVCANLHTPLQNKVSVCGQILDNYEFAVATGTDPIPWEVQPPVNLLRSAYQAGKEAAKSGEADYTAKRGEEL
jgi:transcriptional regulator with XRE-family HTH domain